MVQKYEPAAKSQLKKIQKLWVRDQHKNEAKDKREEEDAEKRAKNLEEAKKLIIEEDKSLPNAEIVKISQTGKYREKRIKVSGWVHRLRRQGKFPLRLKLVINEVYIRLNLCILIHLIIV